MHRKNQRLNQWLASHVFRRLKSLHGSTQFQQPAKPLTSNSRADGRFDKRDFVYIAKRDEYRCPAGERAIWRFSTIENGLTIHKYWSSACPRCSMKSRCTPSK